MEPLNQSPVSYSQTAQPQAHPPQKKNRFDDILSKISDLMRGINERIIQILSSIKNRIFTKNPNPTSQIAKADRRAKEILQTSNSSLPEENLLTDYASLPSVAEDHPINYASIPGHGDSVPTQYATIPGPATTRTNTPGTNYGYIRRATNPSDSNTIHEEVALPQALGTHLQVPKTSRSKPRSLSELGEVISNLFHGISLKHLGEIGHGAYKAAHKFVISGTQEQVKEIRTQIKNEKRAEAEKKTEKIASTIFSKADQMEINFNDPLKKDQLLKDIQKFITRIPEIEKLNKELSQVGKSIQTIQDFIEKKIDLDVLHDELTRKEFFIELQELITHSQFSLVITTALTSAPDEEIKLANFVKNKLLTISQKFKDFLSIPKIFEFDGEQVPVNILYNLKDINDLRNNLEPEEKYEAALQAAKGLAALHEAGVIHGDFAARNVFANQTIDKEGNYKLHFAVSDWGLVHEEGEKWRNPNKAPLLWCSPELIKRAALSTKSDVWSYGVYLLELLAPDLDKILDLIGDDSRVKHVTKVAAHHAGPGRTFDPTQPQPYMESLINKNLPPDLNPDMKKLLLSCFIYDPAARPSMLDIIEGLGHLDPKLAFKIAT